MHNDITVLDVLSLPIMRNASVKAGRRGLSNTIKYVNVLDNLYDDTATSDQLPKFGENFYITSMYYGKNDPDYILCVTRHFIEVHAAAVCIIDEYLTELPAEVYALCDEACLPVIFINKNTPYPLIISSIMELKLSYLSARETEAALQQLADPAVSREAALQILHRLAPDLEENVQILHLLPPSSQEEIGPAAQIHLIARLNEQRQTFAGEYKGGVLCICSHKNTERLSDQLKDVLKTSYAAIADAAAGISAVHPLAETGAAMTEAVKASQAAPAGDKTPVYYQQLGVCQLLLPLLGSPGLEAYYDNIFSPLHSYDKKYSAHLLETVTAFVENQMDYTKTSRALFVHENTIRYRLNKIKTLIPYGLTDLDFQHTLYLFCQIMDLKKIR